MKSCIFDSIGNLSKDASKMIYKYPIYKCTRNGVKIFFYQSWLKTKIGVNILITARQY